MEDQNDDTPIWGLKNIAKEIRQTVSQTHYMLRNGRLPARQIGEKWVTTRGELRRALKGETA
ncbi:MAG: hypothetical protein K0M55_15780 [Rhizobium sp.]|nr:hypothetical protein [Rhizobium sp.]MBW8319257.1 hypothetical protein [Rhizobium sp.]